MEVAILDVDALAIPEIRELNSIDLALQLRHVDLPPADFRALDHLTGQAPAGEPLQGLAVQIKRLGILGFPKVPLDRRIRV